jgi:hypothetical protein
VSDSESESGGWSRDSPLPLALPPLPPAVAVDAGRGSDGEPNRSSRGILKKGKKNELGALQNQFQKII